MDEKISNETDKKLTNRFEINKRTWVIIALPFIMAFALIWGYYTRFGSCLSDTPAPNTSGVGLGFACLYSFSSEQWGQAGDFLGGILNPLIGLVTVILVVLSIRQNHIALQQNQAALEQNERALKDSKEELKISNTALHEQKDLMAAEYRERCFTSLIASLNFNLDKKIVTGQNITTLEAVLNACATKMYVTKVGLITDDDLQQKLKEFFQQQLQYVTGLSSVYRMETNKTGKEMLGLRLLSGTSIGYLFVFGMYVILLLQQTNSRYKEKLQAFDDNPALFVNENERETDNFLGHENMYLDALVMLIDTIHLSAAKGLSEKLDKEMHYYKQSR